VTISILSINLIKSADTVNIDDRDYQYWQYWYYKPLANTAADTEIFKPWETIFPKSLIQQVVG